MYIYHGSVDISKVLMKISTQSTSQIRCKEFNTMTSSKLLDDFLNFMSEHTNLEVNGINLMKSLKIFKSVDFDLKRFKYLSCNEQNNYVVNLNLPVRLPTDFIIANEKSVLLLISLGAKEVKEETLVEIILTELKNGSKYGEQEKIKFMQYFLRNISKYSKQQKVKDLAREIAFLRSDSNIFKAKDLFNPDVKLLKILFYGEINKFPLDYQNTSNYSKLALRELGLKETNMVSAQNIAEVANLIHRWSKDPQKYEICVTKSHGVLDVLNENPSLLQKRYERSTLKIFLKDKRFVACSEEKSNQYPTSFQRFKGKLCVPSEACEKTIENEFLVGATMPLVETKYTELLFSLGFNSLPPCKKVIEQLLLLKQYHNDAEQSSLLHMIEKIYHFLSENIESVDISTFEKGGLIWTGASFELPSNVVIKVDRQRSLDLRPYLYSIPVEFERYEVLFKRAGCKPYQSIEVLISTLVLIEKKHQSQQTVHAYERDFEIVIMIIDKLANKIGQLKDCDVILPIQNNSTNRIQFQPASKCVIEEFGTNSNVVHKGGNSSVFVSRRISHESAKALGAKDQQRQSHDEISVGIPFGQREKLVSRIKNLLQSYPCDSSIMKELLQNADDAKASTIVFIKDYRDHSTQNIFSESCKDFQRPSLCVFNDSYFTDKDLQGIHDLGEGSKRDDPSKIGRYGVGFNSVYHLTDTPSFLSKNPDMSDDGFLVIFDPSCCYLPGVDETSPGRKYNVKDLQVGFPNMLSGFDFREELFTEGRGTLFRFPLRTVDSSLSDKIHSKQTIDNIIEEMVGEMFESLLFVKNVQSIHIANMTSGKLEFEYSVRAEVSKSNKSKRSKFFNHIDGICGEVEYDRSKLIFTEKKEVCYEMKISDSKDRVETFMIVQKFGFDNLSEIPDCIVEIFRREHFGFLPWGGVALPIASNQEKILHTSDHNTDLSYKGYTSNKSLPESKAFCFLPIPGKIPFPVHINGCFRLDDARRNLVKDGFGKEWNECILKFIIVVSYAQCVSLWKDSFADRVDKLKSWRAVNDLSFQYHKSFPKFENILDPYWKFLTVEFYRHVIYNKYELFPVFKVIKETKGKKQFECRWVPIGLKGDLHNGCFNTLWQHMISKHEERDLESILKDVGMKIVHSPMAVKKAVEKSGICFESNSTKAALENTENPNGLHDSFKVTFCTEPDEVLAFIASSTVHEGSCLIGSPGSPITGTNILSTFRLNILLQFLTKSKEFVKALPSLLVLLTENNELNQFSKENVLYCSEFSWMFPEEMDKFVHHELIHAYPTSDLVQEGYMQHFSISSFVDLIPNMFKRCLFNKTCVEWEKGCNTLPSIQWILMFWKFIHDESKSIKHNDSNTFKENLDMISEWAVVPVDDEGRKKLLRVDKAFLLIDMESFNSDESLKASLLEIRPLVLDENIFYEGKYIKFRPKYSETLIRDQQIEKPVQMPLAMGMECFSNLIYRSEEEQRNRSVAVALIESIKQLITTKKRPQQLLENIVYIATNFDPSRFDNLSNESANSILQYFTESLRDPDFRNYNRCKDKLMRLPLFVTLNECRVTLDDQKQVFVVEPCTPGLGLDNFCEKTKTVIVQYSNKHDDLYDFLGLTFLDGVQFYTEVILPNISNLPRESWLSHIEFIKNNLLKKHIGGHLSKTQETLLTILKDIAFIETDKGFRKSSFFFDHTYECFKNLCTDDYFLPKSFKTNHWIGFLKKLGMHQEMTDELLIWFAKKIEDKSATDSSIKAKSITLRKCFISKISSWKAETLETIATIRFMIPVELGSMYQEIFPQKDGGSKLICMNGSVTSENVELCWSIMNVLNIPSSSNIFNQGNCIEEIYHNKLGIDSEPSIFNVVKHCQNITSELCKKVHCFSETRIIEMMSKIYSFLRANIRSSRDKRMLQDLPIVHLPSEGKMVTVSDIVDGIADNEIIKPYLFKAPSEYGPYNRLFLYLGASQGVKCYHYINVLHAVMLKVGIHEIAQAEFDVVKKAVSCLSSCLRDEQKREYRDIDLFLPNNHRVMCKSTAIVMVDCNTIRERLVNRTDINYFIGSQELGISSFDPHEFVSLLPKQLQPKLLTDIVKEEVNRESMECISKSTTVDNLSCLIKSEQFIKGICRVMKKDRFTGNHEFNMEVDVERISKLLGKVNLIQVSKLETYLLYKEEIIENSHRPLDYFFEQKNGKDGLHSLQFYFCLFQDSNQAKALIDILCSPGGLAEALVKHLKLSYTEVLMVANLLRESDNPCRICLILDKMKYPDLNLSLDIEALSIFHQPGSYVEEKFHSFLQKGLHPFAENEYLKVALKMDDSESDDEIEDNEFTPAYKYVRMIEMIQAEHDIPSIVDIRYKIDIGEQELMEVPGERLYQFVRPEHQAEKELHSLRFQAPTRAHGYVDRQEAENIYVQAEVKDVGEARRWMKQAKYDFQLAESILPQAEDQKAFNWVCYMCHQASEKALKAGCYNKNANAVSLQDHFLQQPASVLSAQLNQTASEMEALLGHHTKMRYPNSLMRPQIPADIFTKSDAEKAIEFTRDIIERTDDLM